MKTIIHFFRKFIYGECPVCGSTNIKDMKGWGKDECQDCGRNWRRW
jgi:transposase-like protein